MKRWAFSLLLCAAVASFIAPAGAHAQSTPDAETIEKAVVTSIRDEGDAIIEGTNVTSSRQSITARVITGPDTGATPTFDNDYTQLAIGDVFYIRHLTNTSDSTDFWSVADPYRLPWLIGLTATFLVLLLLFGGIQGIRAIVTLVGSLVLIFSVLLPSIYAGHSPILISIGVASVIIFVGSYVTHGVNRATTSAMLGMLATVIITGIATYAVIHGARLSGFSTETNAYLNFGTDGRIDMLGLLFGGIMIGLLGVLYDIAIGQAIAVEELYRASSYAPRMVFARALRIGREHIGALVNTLAIAYVGSALPLLLLFKESTGSLGFIINSEIFSGEIIRILMGSIGIIIAVPLTTLIATYLLSGTPKEPGASEALHHHH